MKSKLLILSGIFLFFQFGFSNACGLRYEMEKNKVHYYLDFKNKLEIKEADYKTFEIISNALAKDKNNVYYRGKIIVDVNPKTFKIIKKINNLVFDCDYISYVLEDEGKKYELNY